MWFTLPIFGSGDELQINFTAKKTSNTLQIDRSGDINIAKLGRWYLRD
jgi:hypothetical protein